MSEREEQLESLVEAYEREIAYLRNKVREVSRKLALQEQVTQDAIDISFGVNPYVSHPQASQFAQSIIDGVNPYTGMRFR